MPALILEKRFHGNTISHEERLRRFWRNVDKRDYNECWEWLGGKTSDGRGELSVGDYTQVRAHRYMFVLSYGTIPRGKMVCHKCSNPGCVNPLHLYAGTGSDNMRDFYQLHPRGGTGWWGRRGGRYMAFDTITTNGKTGEQDG